MNCGFVDNPTDTLELAGVLLVADLQIPTVGIEHVKALETFPNHIRSRIQPAFFEFSLDFGCPALLRIMIPPTSPIFIEHCFCPSSVMISHPIRSR